jgi:outer membrane beta-barrel protein
MPLSSSAAARALALGLALAGAGAARGAPPADPDLAVHVVEAKPFPDQALRELVLFPVVPQVNGRFTQHLGTQGSLVWHLQENFALQLTGGGNWLAGESSFNAELATRAQVAAQAATSLLWTWGMLAGVEVSPVYGKLTWLDGALAHFNLVLSAGAGAGGTVHQLKPRTTRDDGSISPASYGDTGVRFLGSLGLGLRLRLGSRVALRLEVRDVIYSARVDHVNGCGLGDLAAMDSRVRSGLSIEGTAVSSGCDLKSFSGRSAAGDSRAVDASLAYQLVKGDNGVPSSDVLHNVGAYLGISFLF